LIIFIITFHRYLLFIVILLIFLGAFDHIYMIFQMNPAAAGCRGIGFKSWSWLLGASFFELASWSWLLGAGFSELASLSWLLGAGFLELASWSWLLGAGYGELNPQKKTGAPVKKRLVYNERYRVKG
jgi:hypothetical protein